MNVAASGRTWEDASSPAALRLTREYEESWRKAQRSGRRLEPGEFLSSLHSEADHSGARLAILRADLALRWDSGERIGARWYVDRFPDLGDDTLVALIYEEYCLREDRGEQPEVAEFLTRYPALAEPLRRVLDIHQLIGSTTTSHSMILGEPLSSRSTSPTSPGASPGPFPEAGQTIGGFLLVEELGRGAFGRVFLARERQLADRLVALKVTRKSSREPQALARLQHTHIVPVHSHRFDKASGLHLLCMPYFGRITLSRVLAEVGRDEEDLSGASLLEALDRLAGSKEDGPQAGKSACRGELFRRTYPQAIAWWGARLAEALEHAHDRGVLHRDIKPSNVLVIEDGMPMLLDFNLARESVRDDQVAGEATLGGTVDYMAPEHLEALAEGYSDQVDHRSDIFGLGVLLFEAVAGRKPFRPPAKGRSVVDALLRVAEERRRDPTGLFQDIVGMPPPLRAVIHRCLEPAPQDRYQSAGELAADLTAVADELPLVYAREPLLSRVRRGMRRNRRRLATTSLAFVAIAAMLGAYLNVQFERHDRFKEIVRLYTQGSDEIERSQFNSASILLNNASQRADQLQRTRVESLFTRDTIRNFPAKLRNRLKLLWADPDLDDLQERIRYKAEIAKHVGTTRERADNLLAKSDNLRFRLLGLGGDLPDAVEDLKQGLAPFYVLNFEQSWNDLEHIWDILDETRARRLKHEVNELLFLWMVGVEESFRGGPSVSSTQRGSRDPALIDAAQGICDRALTFAEPTEPWMALRTLLERQRGEKTATTTIASERKPATPGAGALLPGEPQHITSTKSATACFQWGLLCSSHGDRQRAIKWLQQAVWLEWSNYWYQFYLAFLEDKAGLSDDALDHYSAAVVGLPTSPWVRFSRGRLYRIKGRWDWALDDMRAALKQMGDAPEAFGVRLEIGVLHQTLGDYRRASSEYQAVVEKAPGTEYARAARLNLANIAAESGRDREALAAYDDLLKENPADTSARFSRVLLNLRGKRPDTAIEDLNRLILARVEVSRARPGELLAQRATAQLVARRPAAALEDAREAMRRWPCPANERLLQRSLLAARCYTELELERPEEIRLLPVGGKWLTEELRSAAAALEKTDHESAPTRYRMDLNRSIILSALGEHGEALRAADAAVALSPLTPRGFVIRARVRREASDWAGAMSDVEAGLKIQPDLVSLRELRGLLLAESGNRGAALADLDLAISRAPSPWGYAARAFVLEKFGDPGQAVYEWSHALQRDVALPQAYLGRARCYVRLRAWERALADLEQASSWAGGDLSLQASILLTYWRCLTERPDHRDRFRLLLDRTMLEVRDRWFKLPPASEPDV